MAMSRILDFMRAVLMVTAEQLVTVLGVFFMFGLILFFLSRLTRNLFKNARCPRLDIYLTGWIGTPVHELGHAVFCIIFGHKIKEIKLFSPKNNEASLGYVSHSFNRKSYYQKIGNFFIGAGPLIFGTIVIYMLMYYLLPNRREVFELLSNRQIERITIANFLTTYPLVLSFSAQLLGSVFTPSNFSLYGFWAFIYASCCIASHMALSPSDMKGMWYGLLVIAMLLLVINIVSALLKTDVTWYVMKVHNYTAGFISLFIFASLLSFLNLCISFIFLRTVCSKKGGSA